MRLGELFTHMCPCCGEIHLLTRTEHREIHPARQMLPLSDEDPFPTVNPLAYRCDEHLNAEQRITSVREMSDLIIAAQRAFDDALTAGRNAAQEKNPFGPNDPAQQLLDAIARRVVRGA